MAWWKDSAGQKGTDMPDPAVYGNPALVHSATAFGSWPTVEPMLSLLSESQSPWPWAFAYNTDHDHWDLFLDTDPSATFTTTCGTLVVTDPCYVVQKPARDLTGLGITVTISDPGEAMTVAVHREDDWPTPGQKGPIIFRICERKLSRWDTTELGVVCVDSGLVAAMDPDAARARLIWECVTFAAEGASFGPFAFRGILAGRGTQPPGGGAFPAFAAYDDTGAVAAVMVALDPHDLDLLVDPGVMYRRMRQAEQRVHAEGRRRSTRRRRTRRRRND